MKEDESPFADYSEDFPAELDEETSTLLKLAQAHILGKHLFASDEDVLKRSKEKGIPYYQAKKELINEHKSEREKIVKEAQKLLTPNLSKATKQKLGIKGAGRPKGSRSKKTKISKADL